MSGREIVLCKWQPDLLGALLELGARVHLVLDRYDRFGDTADGLLAGCAQVYRVASVDSLEELGPVAVDLRLRGAQVDQVLSFHELGQAGARHLEQLLGLANDPMRSVALRDKRLMKTTLQAAGVPVTRFASVSGPGDAEGLAAVKELQGPVVVKPAAGYGAINTVKVADVADVGAVVEEMVFDPMQRSRQMIVEEFVEGYELMVDATWTAGRMQSFVVHPYHGIRMDMNTRTSLDGSLVLAERDEPDLYRRLLDLHERANRALGITDWATHLEAFVQPDGGIVFSEVANRPGGAWIPLMLSSYFGRPSAQVLAEVAVTGTCAPARSERDYVGAVHVGPSEPGRITRFPTDEELAAGAGVLSWSAVRKVGDRARMSHPSDYCLHVVFGADSAAELESLCANARASFPIETEPW